jgi:hypothetical protein
MFLNVLLCRGSHSVQYRTSSGHILVLSYHVCLQLQAVHSLQAFLIKCHIPFSSNTRATRLISFIIFHLIILTMLVAE